MSQADRPPLDHILAGLLNGVALSSIGVAVPVFFAWGGLTHFDGQAPSFRVSGLFEQPAAAAIAVVLLLAGVRALMVGVGMVRRNVALLRARRAG